MAAEENMPALASPEHQAPRCNRIEPPVHTLTSLPLPILLENILCLLPSQAIYRLACSNKQLFWLVLSTRTLRIRLQPGLARLRSPHFLNTLYYAFTVSPCVHITLDGLFLQNLAPGHAQALLGGVLHDVASLGKIRFLNCSKVAWKNLEITTLVPHWLWDLLPNMAQVEVKDGVSLVPPKHTSHHLSLPPTATSSPTTSNCQPLNLATAPQGSSVPLMRGYGVLTDPRADYESGNPQFDLCKDMTHLHVSYSLSQHLHHLSTWNPLSLASWGRKLQSFTGLQHLSTKYAPPQHVLETLSQTVGRQLKSLHVSKPLHEGLVVAERVTARHLLMYFPHLETLQLPGQVIGDLDMQTLVRVDCLSSLHVAAFALAADYSELPCKWTSVSVGSVLDMRAWSRLPLETLEVAEVRSEPADAQLWGVKLSPHTWDNLRVIQALTRCRYGVRWVSNVVGTGHPPELVVTGGRACDAEAVGLVAHQFRRVYEGGRVVFKGVGGWPQVDLTQEH